MNSSTARLLKARPVLHFGHFRQQMEVRVVESMENESIGLSSSLSRRALIPTDIPYEVHVTGKDLHIGPVIGLMVKKHDGPIPDRFLKELEVRFKFYDNIKGLIYVFTENDIDPDYETITGYYYVPNTKARKTCWQKGEFHYPGSIVINRTGISRSMYHHLKDRIGNTIFNSFSLSKWQQYQVIAKSKSLLKFVPETVLFEDMESLRKMLDLHGSVYLKAKRSKQGRGIMFVQKTGAGYLLKNEFMVEYHFQQFDKLTRYLRKQINQPYLIQQAVPVQFNGHNIDFRIYLQKNRNKKWVSPGITARIAKPGSIITNSRNREKVLSGTEALTTYYGLTEPQAKAMEEKMVNICKETAYLVDQEDIHYGDAAFDIIVDKKLGIWILEFQGGYSVEKKVNEIPPDIFERIVGTPFEYAKTLAGF
ncbi:YheC/YheD family endospore coat-associated protein [Peribacillus glennii]|uniref:YheC/YheD family endospore coat-associated protein n=1 Tax=Peribacillus glennii TaxID=2303991 RepID=UPI00131411D0|nr:YheC/YheD family protein [Peribacillus glennii]